MYSPVTLNGIAEGQFSKSTEPVTPYTKGPSLGEDRSFEACENNSVSPSTTSTCKSASPKPGTLTLWSDEPDANFSPLISAVKSRPLICKSKRLGFSTIKPNSSCCSRPPSCLGLILSSRTVGDCGLAKSSTAHPLTSHAIATKNITGLLTPNKA